MFSWSTSVDPAVIDLQRFDLIPEIFRRMAKPLGGMKADLKSHRNTFIGYRREGEIAAVGIFTTMLDHEVVVPLSLAFAPGADVCKITSAFLQAGFCLEKGYCGGVQRFFAVCVQDRAVWEAVSLLAECQLFPNPALAEPVEVMRVREQLPRLYGLPGRLESHPLVSDWFLGVGQVSMEVLK